MIATAEEGPSPLVEEIGQDLEAMSEHQRRRNLPAQCPGLHMSIHRVLELRMETRSRRPRTK